MLPNNSSSESKKPAYNLAAALYVLTLQIFFSYHRQIHVWGVIVVGSAVKRMFAISWGRNVNVNT